jgi:hypothetical protein
MVGGAKAPSYIYNIIKVMQFNTKEQVVEALVNEFKEQKSSFYNTNTNKQREKFWTFNRTFNYYLKKKNNG